jgi:hypothetical protein
LTEERTSFVEGVRQGATCRVLAVACGKFVVRGLWGRCKKKKERLCLSPAVALFYSSWWRFLAHVSLPQPGAQSFFKRKQSIGLLRVHRSERS